jgi:hypothetical protein
MRPRFRSRSGDGVYRVDHGAIVNRPDGVIPMIGPRREYPHRAADRLLPGISSRCSGSDPYSHLDRRTSRRGLSGTPQVRDAARLWRYCAGQASIGAGLYWVVIFENEVTGTDEVT